MTNNQVIRSLNVIRNKFRPILASNASTILMHAISEINNSYEHSMQEWRRQRKISPWGYNIYPDNPLTFLPAIVRDITFQVDLFGRFYWGGEDSRLIEHNLVLRVWCNDPKIIMRDGLDSEEVIHRLNKNKGRVMLRFHFDRSNDNQPGPLYHIQVGGNPRNDEACWLCECVSVPRLPYPPLDIVLGCELVVANFFSNSKQISILDDPVWLGAVRHSQDEIIKNYFERCLGILERQDGCTLLKHLWGGEWR